MYLFIPQGKTFFTKIAKLLNTLKLFLQKLIIFIFGNNSTLIFSIFQFKKYTFIVQFLIVVQRRLRFKN
jgi:hypothetical protein